MFKLLAAYVFCFKNSKCPTLLGRGNFEIDEVTLVLTTLFPQSRHVERYGLCSHIHLHKPSIATTAPMLPVDKATSPTLSSIFCFRRKVNPYMCCSVKVRSLRVRVSFPSDGIVVGMVASSESRIRFPWLLVHLLGDDHVGTIYEVGGSCGHCSPGVLDLAVPSR